MLQDNDLNTGPRRRNVLVLGVNPFEDVPGYHYLALLKGANDKLWAADDSKFVVDFFASIGYDIAHIPHPCLHSIEYISRFKSKLATHRFDLVIPGTDGHLLTLAQHYPELSRLGVPILGAKAVHDAGVRNKSMVQDIVGNHFNTPKRWAIESHSDFLSVSSRTGFPVVMKGQRKGAVKCNDSCDLNAGFRHLMDNPLNRGADGGVFLEEYIPGEEHSIILSIDRYRNIRASIAMRKLATSKEGTTLAGVIENVAWVQPVLAEFAQSLPGPLTIELEYRVPPHETTPYVFEVNLRLPTWISALGACGVALLRDQISHEMDSLYDLELPLETFPLPGTMIYRLPASGILDVNSTFSVIGEHVGIEITANQLRHSAMKAVLAAGRSPHGFLIK